MKLTLKKYFKNILFEPVLCFIVVITFFALYQTNLKSIFLLNLPILAVLSFLFLKKKFSIGVDWFSFLIIPFIIFIGLFFEKGNYFINDYAFYSRLSNYLNNINVENTYVDYLFGNERGCLPYHYIDVWTLSFFQYFGYQLNLSEKFIYLFLYLPFIFFILNIASVFFLKTLVSKYQLSVKKNIIYFLSLIIPFLISIDNLYAFQFDSIYHTPKLVFPLFFILLILSFQMLKWFDLVYVIISLFIITYSSLMPSLFLYSFFVILIEIYLIRKVNFYMFLPLITVLFWGVFYSFFKVENNFKLDLAVFNLKDVFYIFLNEGKYLLLFFLLPLSCVFYYRFKVKGEYLDFLLAVSFVVSGLLSYGILYITTTDSFQFYSIILFCFQIILVLVLLILISNFKYYLVFLLSFPFVFFIFYQNPKFISFQDEEGKLKLENHSNGVYFEYHPKEINSNIIQSWYELSPLINYPISNSLIKNNSFVFYKLNVFDYKIKDGVFNGYLNSGLKNTPIYYYYLKNNKPEINAKFYVDFLKKYNIKLLVFDKEFDCNSIISHFSVKSKYIYNNKVIFEIL